MPTFNDTTLQTDLLQSAYFHQSANPRSPTYSSPPRTCPQRKRQPQTLTPMSTLAHAYLLTFKNHQVPYLLISASNMPTLDEAAANTSHHRSSGPPRANATSEKWPSRHSPMSTGTAPVPIMRGMR